MRPRNICGPIKNLFVRGYKIINRLKQKLIKMVFALVRLSKIKLKNPRIKNRAQLSFIDTLLLGIGLNIVLSTLPSRSLYHISLIPQPADQTKMLPITIIKTSEYIKLPPVLIINANNAGQSKRYIPIGLSGLMSSRTARGFFMGRSKRP